MVQPVSDRQGMPKSVVVGPVVMLVVGVVASVGLWVLLNQEPALMVRATSGGATRLLDAVRTQK